MVYLSIQNISNFKELTDKRILEEQKEVHGNYVVTFQESLDLMTTDLSEIMTQYSMSGVFDVNELRNDLVSDILIMTTEGELLHPYFSAPHYSHMSSRLTTDFSRLFEQGERIEFLGNDLSAAQNSYMAALDRASSGRDSAQVYNALSRLKVKRDLQKGACDYFEIIITKFGDAQNNFGLPYPYFSVDQLLKMNDPELTERKIELIAKFLNQLNSGSIPFMPNTSVVLADLKSFLESTTFLKEDNSFSEGLNRAVNTVSLIDNYSPILAGVGDGSGISEYESLGFFQVHAALQASEEVLLTGRSGDFIYGFVIPLNALDEHARKNLKTDSFTFSYTVALAERVSGSPSPNPIHKFEDSFSSYFPYHNLYVTIEDESHVSDFIFRRTLITIIGLGLLLAAMIIGFIMLVRDVQRKKTMEKLRADFVANVTHELKTPLTSINMFADSILLDRVKSESGYKKYAQIIVKESERLKRMVNNILEFSRQENAALRYELQEEKLSELMEQILDEMNYWLTLHHFELTLDLNDNLYVQVNGEGFKQVMSNLITNAIKYSTNVRTIKIRTYAEGALVKIDVEDQGIGIPADKMKSIFRKFYRVSEDSGSVSGTGLGLTVSKEIIEAMGGTLTVASEVDKGSTFTITLNTSIS
jgi:signal transduction histidine kinase